jgi:endonuclease/exonuclease/phosphatase family metal-dependent hydrolase
MTRDPAFIEECAEIRRALQAHATLASLRTSRGWTVLETRIGRVLDALRRLKPNAPPAPPADPARVRAVHWNIEHGNRYEQVERELFTHPKLQRADIVMLNEVDLGMARSGNRDVAGDLAAALGLHGVWAPMLIETTLGRDDDPLMAQGRENLEGLFGLAILSRWPIGEVRAVELPSPERIQFELERMYGRHVALVAVIERPGAPFVAVSVHLEVHRTRMHRAAQMVALLEALRHEGRPVLLAGDFNSHTFDRGHWWYPMVGASVLFLHSDGDLEKRLLYADRGGSHEWLFDGLRDAGFEWERFIERGPTLQLRFDRLEEARGPLRLLGGPGRSVLAWAERRARLRLDWFAGRGWRDGRGFTVSGLDGPGKASDHAPIAAEFA